MPRMRQSFQAPLSNPRGQAIDPPARSAFTLVELLVVVGVLVFVIAMLIPAFSKAQRQARTVTCLSNLHQLYMGYAAYLPQNHQQSLRYDATLTAIWPEALRATFPDGKDMLICPEAATPSYNVGSMTTAWGPYDADHGSPAAMKFLGSNSSSYGFNGFLYALDGQPQAGEFPSRSPGWEHVPVFADATWIDGWPVTNDTVGKHVPPAGRGEEAGIARFDIARHGHATNASFLDGHAEQFPIEQVHEWKWSNPLEHDASASETPPR